MTLTKQLKNAALALFLMLTMAMSAANADVLVVVSAKSPVAELSNQQVANIFLGKTSRLPSGERVEPVDQKEGAPLRDEFYLKLVDKSPSQIKAHWSKLVFTGRGQPPKEVLGSRAVKRTIATNPAAIGYIDPSEQDASVRVVLIVQ